MKPRLELWYQFHDCIVAYVFDDLHWPNATHVRTAALRFIDLNNFEAEDIENTKYKLGTPGNKEHHETYLSKLSSSSDGVKKPIETSMFLNPDG